MQDQELSGRLLSQAGTQDALFKAVYDLRRLLPQVSAQDAVCEAGLSVRRLLLQAAAHGLLSTLRSAEMPATLVPAIRALRVWKLFDLRHAVTRASFRIYAARLKKLPPKNVF